MWIWIFRVLHGYGYDGAGNPRWPRIPAGTVTMYAVSPRLRFSIRLITADMGLVVRSADIGLGTWDLGSEHWAVGNELNA